MQEGCKLPSRHGHVTWFGTNAYVHGTPRLFRSPSCTTPPRRCRQVPTRHRVSCTATVSLGHPAEIHYGASPPRRGSPLPPHKVSVATPHQVGGSHDGSQGLLAAARLLSRELSQELVPITSTKHSHKCAQAYMMCNEVLWWLEMIFGSCILPWSPELSNEPWGGIDIAHTPQTSRWKKTDKKRYHRLNRCSRFCHHRFNR